MVDPAGGAEGWIQLNICVGRVPFYNPSGIPVVRAPAPLFPLYHGYSSPGGSHVRYCASVNVNLWWSESLVTNSVFVLQKKAVWIVRIIRCWMGISTTILSYFTKSEQWIKPNSSEQLIHLLRFVECQMKDSAHFLVHIPTFSTGELVPLLMV